MTSQRKIEANRRNARNSCGPRTVMGKARASRNAPRHGLSTVSSVNPAYTEEIEQIAELITGGEADPLLYAQAVRIAECDVLLRCIGNEKIVAIERLHDPTTLALARQRHFSRVLAHLKAWGAEFELACFELESIRGKVDARFEESGWSDANWEPVPEWDWRQVAVASRDEYAAIYEAQPDLERLARYERRTRSRLKRATRAFIAVGAEARLTSGDHLAAGAQRPSSPNEHLTIGPEGGSYEKD